MSDLLAEVDEMMRQERMVKLWKEHGNTLIAIIVAIILGTALSAGYKSWNKSVKESGTAALITALDDPSFPANISAEELEMRPGLKGLGLLSAAGTYLSEGKTDEALELLTQMEADKSIPDDLRDLAIISAVRIQAAQEEPPADLTERLSTITKNSKSPWRYHAHLESAVILATHQQKYAEAIEHLNAITDTPNLPASLYNKARALDRVYALKQYEESKESENSDS